MSYFHQNFSLEPDFSADCENRVACRSRVYLGPGNNICKSYDKNKTRRRRHNFWNRRWRVMGHPWQIADHQQYICIVWQICFRHKFSKKYPQDLKIVKKRRATRFSSICAKNQALKFWWKYDNSRFKLTLSSEPPRKYIHVVLHVERYSEYRASRLQ